MAGTFGRFNHLNTLVMRKLKIFISGQKKFGEDVLRLCIEAGHEVVGICCPPDDKYIGKLADTFDIHRVASGCLNYDTLPPDFDLGITAHSWDYIGKRSRYKANIGWIGYHPSLLPRHRGRSSIEWAIRMRDAVTGGTVFWLNAGIDRGDIAYQDWCFIDPRYYAMEPRKGAAELWRAKLLPIGIDLLGKAVADISAGNVVRKRQDARFSTFEPSTNVRDVFKPDLLLLGWGSSNGA